jgi:ankyrin repeat protein
MVNLEQRMQLQSVCRLFALALGVVTSCTLYVAGSDAAGQTPLWTQLEDDLRRALQHPDRDRIRALLAAGANVNARDDIGGTALHVAVNFRGDLEVIRMLLDRGADINALDNNGDTPLLLALRHGHYRHEGKGERLYAVAAFLLSRGASARIVGKDGALPVRAAMDPVNIPLIRLLIKHGAALPDDGFEWALSIEHVDLVKEMLPLATPAMLALKGPSGGGMLHLAAEKPKLVFAMEWLAGKGFDLNAVDADGITPFGRAAFYENLPGMAWLHSRNARMHVTSTDGQTLLHLAAYSARQDVMQWLIARGADPKVRNKRGQTPLDIAIDTHPFAFYDEARKLELVTMLGGGPADIARGRFSNSPLHQAVENYDIRTVEKLLAAGANPNVKNSSGHTPLFRAIALASGGPATRDEIAFGKKLLPLLIRYGADPNMPMADGQTYAQWARGMWFGDKLEEVVRRHAPRKK